MTGTLLTRMTTKRRPRQLLSVVPALIASTVLVVLLERWVTLDPTSQATSDDRDTVLVAEFGTPGRLARRRHRRAGGTARRVHTARIAAPSRRDLPDVGPDVRTPDAGRGDPGAERPGPPRRAGDHWNTRSPSGRCLAETRRRWSRAPTSGGACTHRRQDR